MWRNRKHFKVPPLRPTAYPDANCKCPGHSARKILNPPDSQWTAGLNRAGRRAGREAHIYKGLLKTLNDSSFCSTTTRGESSLLSVCRLETQERCGFSAAADGRACSPLIAVSDAYLASHGGVSPKHLRCESCARPKSAKKNKRCGRRNESGLLLWWMLVWLCLEKEVSRPLRSQLG